MSIMDKLKKNSKLSHTEVLSESKFFTEKDMVTTDVPMLNVALSGSVEGGLAPGLTVLAGPSKHFKTSFALMIASAYLKKYSEAVMLFYDSEFGSPQSYFKQFDIDTSRVLHTPITNVEELKFDMIGQLEALDRKDKVIEWNNLNKDQYNSCLSNLQIVKKEFDENVRKKKDEFSIYT